MAEAPEHREVNDTAEPTLVPFSGGTFEETKTTSSTVVVSRESGSDFIASQRKIFYQSDTVFYQQTSEYFLTYPPAEPMGGLVGRFARLLGGNFKEEPQDMLQMECVDADSTPPSRSNSGSCRLSEETQKMLRDEVFSDGLSPGDVVDYHAHLVGHNDSGSFLHPSTKTWWSPLQRLKGAILMSAAQVSSFEEGDVQYIARLVRLVRHYCPSAVLGKNCTDNQGFVSPRLCLLPFDKFYEKDGRENMEKTTLYVPNDYSFKMAAEFPTLFYPVGSVNPYRKDALKELERCAENGVRVIKWLPNSMGINPSDKECEPFYHKMKELDMALLTHMGDEHTVSAAFLDNSLGNPLHLRRALDCGVKVIAAHCASEGKSEDTDSPAARKPIRSNYDLLQTLMDDPKYHGILFADISALVGFLRVPVLKQVLDNNKIHDRLVYGSDYPLPCVNALTRMRQFTSHGLIQPRHVPCLNELYHFNPLLYDLALKRVVRGPRGGRFEATIFKEHPKLPPCSRENRLTNDAM